MKTSLKLASLAALTTATLALPVAAQDMNNSIKCHPMATAKCQANKCSGKCSTKKCSPMAQCKAGDHSSKCTAKCSAKK